MQKILKIIYIIIGSVIVVAILIMSGLQINKIIFDKQLNQAKEQVKNYNAYKFGAGEYNKLKKSEKNEVYYYAADGKRYVFPDTNTYQSWFGPISIEDLNTYDLLKLYETPLGGNVTCRPGTLLKTITDPNTYIVIGNGHIKAVDNKILDQVFDKNWQKNVIDIANYYFTNYKVDKPIENLSEFPEIPLSITIDQDKDLKNDK
ncbi:hypothetical protein JW977_02830 [Candidatus Falkowbacteria bacterium]|nr:hypothetical protein [Candidatus Falkowbacteria bacterium]